MVMGPRRGTILKKCQCANQERCSHKWTLRYWADGRQREMSFADELDATGRPRYGSGKRLAQDAQLKVAHDKRARQAAACRGAALYELCARSTPSL